MDRKLASLATFLAEHGLAADGWDVRVSPGTGKIRSYTHPEHGRFTSRAAIVRALAADRAGPSRPIEISSDEDADDACPVCLGDLGHDVFTVGRCGHRFCAACIAQHLVVNASDAAIIHPAKNLPRCPTCVAKEAQGKCNADGVLTPQEIDDLHGDGHMSDVVHARLHRAMAMASVPEGDHRVTCPKCDALFLVRPGSGSDRFKVDCPNRECDCKDLCAKCMVTHVGECPAVADEEQTRAFFVGAVPCPGSCGFMLQKRDRACNCLTCGKCRIRVCGLCGADINRVGYGHFNRVNTPCYQQMGADPIAWAKAQARTDTGQAAAAAQAAAAQAAAAQAAAAQAVAAQAASAQAAAAQAMRDQIGAQAMRDRNAAVARAARERDEAQARTSKWFWM